MENTPLVSICCITYNHVNYIRQALDGFMMQKTDFPFEVLVYDDSSNDGTSEIIREYELKYPGIIKPIINDENQFSKGLRGINFKFNFPRARGKYLAICEGDDYWTDPNKLQLQVGFLEKNPEFSFSLHHADKLREGRIIRTKPPSGNAVFTIKDLIINLPVPKYALSGVYRKSTVEFPIPKIWQIEGNLQGDLIMQLMAARHGKIKYFSKPMAVYRIHNQGVWSSKDVISKLEMSKSNLLFYREGVFKKQPEIQEFFNKGILVQDFLTVEYHIKEKNKKNAHKIFKSLPKNIFLYLRPHGIYRVLKVLAYLNFTK